MLFAIPIAIYYCSKAWFGRGIPPPIGIIGIAGYPIATPYVYAPIPVFTPPWAFFIACQLGSFESELFLRRRR
jgi:hypothetical protein